MPEVPNIAFAVNLKPEQAIDYFKRKGWAISFRWQDTWQQAHAKAFTVAGATKLDILEGIRRELSTALEEGRTFAQFQKELVPTLKKSGWWGRTQVTDPVTGEVRQIDVTPWRLKNIYRTNMQTSYMAGRYRYQQSISEERPYWQYVAIVDESTRPSHQQHNGTVLRAGDPFWDTHYPPNGWGCRCRVRTLSRRALQRRGLKVSDGGGLPGFADRGWGHNPGKAALFDAAELSPDLLPDQRTWKDFGRPDLRSVPATERLAAKLLPQAKDRAAAHQAVADAFGVGPQNPITWIDTPVERVAVDYHKLAHTVEKRSDARERYAQFARKTLEQPFEVWLTRFPDNKYRKQYIGVFATQSLLVSVVVKQDGSLLWNFFQAPNKRMNKTRKGDALLYGK